MLDLIKQTLWNQFGASIDMLQQCIELAPDEHADKDHRYFYVAYHTVLMLDYYLTIPPSGFKARLPFRFMEQEHVPPGVVGDMVPDRIYSRNELLEYLAGVREKCRLLIGSLSEENINSRFKEDFDGDDAMDYNIAEILFYNMRHVQHHAGQLNLMLTQTMSKNADWTFRASSPLYQREN